MNTSLVPVPFHENTLFLIDHQNKPYTPMKPIVEGMGLNWDSQNDKLRNNASRWGIAIIAIPSSGGEQKTVCMPLRKLPGWLMTIQPSRVKPEIREKILRYQNECDDVLWEYWTKGRAEKLRIPLPETERVLSPSSAPLTFEQHVFLRQEIEKKVQVLPDFLHDTAIIHIWTGLLANLGVREKKRIPQYRLSEALDYIRHYPLILSEGRSEDSGRLGALPKRPIGPESPGKPPTPLNLNFPKETARPARPYWQDPPDDPGINPGGLSVQDLLDPGYKSSLLDLIGRLEREGYDMAGVIAEYHALKGHLRASTKAFDLIFKLSYIRRTP